MNDNDINYTEQTAENRYSIQNITLAGLTGGLKMLRGEIPSQKELTEVARVQYGIETFFRNEEKPNKK
jgi:hypothetical protein